MRKLVAAVALILILAASLPAGATYGTVFVRDWRNMAACQCLTDAWVAPGAYARLSPDGKLMAYEVVDLDLLEREGTPDDIGSDALIIGPRSRLMEEFGYSNNEGAIYWVFPSIGY